MPTTLTFDPQTPRVNTFMQRTSFRDKQIQDYILEYLDRGGYGEQDSKGNLKRLHAIDSGRLYRSLYWKAWTTAGGDKVIAEACYNHYGKFVELAVGRGEKYVGLEEVTRRKWKPLYRRDGGKRMGKPFVGIEMRKQARKFAGFLERYFQWQGYHTIQSAVEGLDS
jgi:hypothetical protein